MTPEEIAEAAKVAETPPPAFTADTIAAAVQAGIQAHQSAVESAPKEMTPEERAAYLQIFDPNADGFLDSFTSAITSEEATPEVRAKAIEHLRDGLVNQSIRGAQILIDQRMADMQARFAPLLQSAEVQKAEELWTAFATKHNDLKDHRELVDAVSVQLQAQGYKPASLDEAFTRAADVTRQMISKMTGKPVSTPANPTAPNTMPRMSPTNTNTSAGNPPASGNDTESGVASFFHRRKR